VSHPRIIGPTRTRAGESRRWALTGIEGARHCDWFWGTPKCSGTIRSELPTVELAYPDSGCGTLAVTVTYTDGATRSLEPLSISVSEERVCGKPVLRRQLLTGGIAAALSTCVTERAAHAFAPALSAEVTNPQADTMYLWWIDDASATITRYEWDWGDSSPIDVYPGDVIAAAHSYSASPATVLISITPYINDVAQTVIESDPFSIERFDKLVVREKTGGGQPLSTIVGPRRVKAATEYGWTVEDPHGILFAWNWNYQFADGTTGFVDERKVPAAFHTYAAADAGPKLVAVRVKRKVKKNKTVAFILGPFGIYVVT
jgi:hypothetical protein